MKKKKDYNEYIGKKYGKLTILDFYRKYKYTVYFKCKCDCGKTYCCDAWRIFNGRVNSCGCIGRDEHIQKVKEMGKANRKYEEKCIFCGKEEHYAKGLCKSCYNRKRMNGFLEKKYDLMPLKHRESIPLTESQINMALKVLYENKKFLNKKNKKNFVSSYSKYKRRTSRPKFITLKEYFNDLGLDIYKLLKINKKYMNEKRYVND